ncbi:MAG: class I SAM-dependent methyltransferase [Planctomycetes bacterium]|nr:class I SAM-dependent methyltransferase [Planctomycetota bacterium]MCB9903210.1 class I SAM-dependent methyltransferase [Planctomycetota bacterium]
MDWYERFVFDPLLDRGLDTEAMRRERAALLEGAIGRVLEVGPGTGLNFPHYPSMVRRLSTISPDARLSPRALERAQSRYLELSHSTTSGWKWPFRAASFDTVVCTLVLCTVPDQAAALAEVRRVLTPGGRFLVFEHVRAENALHAACQHLATPFSRVFACGCRSNRRTRRAIEAAGFTWRKVEERRSDALPWLVGTVLVGEAHAAAPR